MVNEWRSWWSFGGAKGLTDALFPIGVVNLASFEGSFFISFLPLFFCCSISFCLLIISFSCNVRVFEGQCGGGWMAMAQSGGTGRLPTARLPNTFTAQGFDAAEPSDPSGWNHFERTCACSGFDSAYACMPPGPATDFFMGPIHPRSKQIIGDRLARAALHHVYGRDDVAWSGPILKGCALSTGATFHREHMTIALDITGKANTIDALSIWTKQISSPEIPYALAGSRCSAWPNASLNPLCSSFGPSEGSCVGPLLALRVAVPLSLSLSLSKCYYSHTLTVVSFPLSLSSSRSLCLLVYVVLSTVLIGSRLSTRTMALLCGFQCRSNSTKDGRTEQTPRQRRIFGRTRAKRIGRVSSTGTRRKTGRCTSQPVFATRSASHVARTSRERTRRALSTAARCAFTTLRSPSSRSSPSLSTAGASARRRWCATRRNKTDRFTRRREASTRPQDRTCTRKGVPSYLVVAPSR